MLLHRFSSWRLFRVATSSQFVIQRFSLSLSSNLFNMKLDRSVFLDTTYVKLDHALTQSNRYIDSLLNEQVKLSEKLLNDISATKEQMLRLNYLNHLTDVVRKYRKCQSDLGELSRTLVDELADESKEENREMRAAIELDMQQLRDDHFELKLKLLDLLVPDDDEDKSNVVLELSAGVGGLESRIFCSELFNMYRMYCSQMSWSFNVTEMDSENNLMGSLLRKCVVEVSGSEVYKLLKFESGVHRVQRVPKTESKGRIHTSTVGVVVTPKPSEIRIAINPKDLKIETKQSGGPGGQHVNKHETCVRIVHLPTGITVMCQDERQQKQNRARAFELLEMKLYQMEYEAQLNKKQANRKMQIGTSGRSERIRTYNYLQDRITDHRLEENLKGIEQFLNNGEMLSQMITNLKYEQRIEILNELVDEFEKSNPVKKSK